MNKASTNALAFALFSASACSTAEPATPVAPSEADGGGGEGAAFDATDAAPSADGAGETAGKYGSDGPEAFTTSTVQMTNAGNTWNEQIYLPTSAGLHPVVTISSGTQQVAAGYAPYARRLASYGILVLVGDDLGVLTPTPSVVDAITYLVSTYVPSSLAAHADMKRVGLSGHSRGGKASLLAAQQGLKGKVVAWFGLDPVDVDVLGNPSALPGIAGIGVPLGFAGASVPSSCSPADANYEVYFLESSHPSVAITLEGAGHFQFEDDSKVVAPTFCTPAGTADSATVLADAVHYMTAFFARELLGDTSVGPSFDGAGAQEDIATGRIKVETK